MRDDIWIERAALLEPFDGIGVTAAQIARQTGLSYMTVRTYAAKFGFDFACRALPSAKASRCEQRRAAVRELAAEGLTRQEVADRLGVTVQTIGNIGRELGIVFVHGAAGLGVDRDRSAAMAAMYSGGKTLQEIGDLYGVTRERVRQIIKKDHGLVGSDGGKAAAAERKRLIETAKKDAEALEKHGCTYAQYRDLVQLGKDMQAQGVGFYRTPTGAFSGQRRNAIARGIAWNLKLWDWWQVWQKSGKWDQRGRGKEAFVMCRFKDDGAYDVGNVYIATHSHNSSFQPNNPYRKDHPDHDKVMAKHRVNLSAAVRQRPISKRVHKDLPVGVTRNNGYLQAQIGINGKNKYLGTFKTVEEAHAAYLNALAAIEARAAA